MKGILLILGLTLASSASALAPGLRVKFKFGLLPGKNFFFDVPRTVTAANIQGWTLTQRPDRYLLSLVLFCPADRILCAYFDDETGIVAGLQIALPQDEIKNAKFDWETQGFVEWVPVTETGEVIKYWCIQQFFVSEEYLQKTPEQRIASYDDSKMLQEDAVWLTGFHGKLDRLSAKASDIENSIYTKQGCLIWMGRHYNYNMSASTPCQADTLYPWFPLVHSGKLVAVGFATYVQMPIKKNQRDWFERPARLAIQLIIPNASTCVYDLVDDPGVLAMHIYYVDKPWLIGCLFQ